MKLMLIHMIISHSNHINFWCNFDLSFVITIEHVLFALIVLSQRAIVIIIDGQAAALRLSKHVKKATQAIKNLAIKFNALGSSQQPVVELTHLFDPQSPVYSNIDLFDQVLFCASIQK